jgi:hypothetical protein
MLIKPHIWSLQNKRFRHSHLSTSEQEREIQLLRSHSARGPVTDCSNVTEHAAVSPQNMLIECIMIMIPSADRVPPIPIPEIVSVSIIHNRSRPECDVDFTITEYRFVYVETKLKRQTHERAARLGVGDLLTLASGRCELWDGRWKGQRQGTRSGIWKGRIIVTISFLILTLKNIRI